MAWSRRNPRDFCKGHWRLVGVERSSWTRRDLRSGHFQKQRNSTICKELSDSYATKLRSEHMLVNQTAFGRAPEIGAKDRQHCGFVKVKGSEQLYDSVTFELGQTVKIVMELR